MQLPHPMDSWETVPWKNDGKFVIHPIIENKDLTARSRGTNRRCPIPRSSSTRQAYSFTSLLLSSCISWDFLMGGASLGAGVGQGTPSSISKKQQISRVRNVLSLKPQCCTVVLWEPVVTLLNANTFIIYSRDGQI